MFALVEIAAQQFRVKPSMVLTVPRLAGEPGDEVQFTNVLAGGDENEPRIGAPYISGSVSATIVEHGKGDKVLVFKKKRRKGYQRLRGHRQQYTKIKITNVAI